LARVVQGNVKDEGTCTEYVSAVVRVCKIGKGTEKKQKTAAQGNTNVQGGDIEFERRDRRTEI